MTSRCKTDSHSHPGISGQVRVAHLGNSSSAANLAGLDHKLRASEAGRRMSRSHWKLGVKGLPEGLGQTASGTVFLEFGVHRFF